MIQEMRRKGQIKKDVVVAILCQSWKFDMNGLVIWGGKKSANSESVIQLGLGAHASGAVQQLRSDKDAASAISPCIIFQRRH